MTDLEACLLGVVWRRGPCSAYSIRKEFARSITAFWSGSTGSVYSAVNRLVAAGLLSAQDQEADGRGTQQLAVTPAGRTALHAWVVGLPERLTASLELVRTRVLYADIMNAEALADFADEATRKTSAALTEAEALRQRLEAQGETAQALATAGACYELRARLEWLDHVRSRLPDLARQNRT